MVLVRPRMNSEANAPPEGVYEPVTITASSQRTGENLTIALHAVRGSELRNGGFANAGEQAYLRLTERARFREEARRGFRDPELLERHRDGIYMIEPYDPTRVPVLMIHGLRSSPEIWRDLTVAILRDPDLHAKVQVWHAFYPTGLPPFYSAALVRAHLRDALTRYDPGGTDLPSHHMAVVGHSMGGVIARTLVTDDGGLLWRTTFSEPPEGLSTTPEHLRQLRSILSLSAIPQIGFAAFVNTPHRGSRTASGPIGRLASSLIRLPQSFSSVFMGNEAYRAQITAEMRPYLLGGAATSVNVLSEAHPLLSALSTIPPRDGVRIASVIGVRGGEECLNRTSCEATDGVVTLKSARLGYGTEIVVDTGHDSYRDPQAIAFLVRELGEWSDTVFSGRTLSAREPRTTDKACPQR